MAIPDKAQTVPSIKEQKCQNSRELVRPVDDISSLRNFICNFITFWSSQGNLSNKKGRKTEENTKKKSCMIWKKHYTI